MSARISAALSLDTQGFQAGITKAEADANKFSARLRSQGVGMFGGKSASESANAIGMIFAAEEKLNATRKSNAFGRLGDAEKLTVLENEIVAAKAKVAAIEGQSLEKLQLELVIEEKLLQVDRLRATAIASQARERESAAAAAAAEQASSAARRAKLLRQFNGSGEEAGGGFARGGASADINGALRRKFGAGDAAKALLAGIGFASIDAIVEKIAGHWKEAAESAKKIEEFTVRAAAATIKLLDLRKTDPQRLALLKRDETSIRGKLASPDVRFGQGTDAEERRAELDAQLKENALAQAELNRKIYDDTRARLDALRSAYKAIDDERSQRDISRLTLEEQLERAKQRQLNYDELALRAKSGSLERARLSLEAEKSITDQVRIKAEIQEKANEAWDRALEEEKKRMRELTDLREKHTDALKRVKEAQDALSTAKSDALGTTVADMTRTASGRRNTTTRGMQAQRILQDEATARRLFQTGGSTTLFDPKAGRNFDAGAEFFQNRALAGRKGLDGLTSGEKDPFSAAAKELSSAAAELKTAASDLKLVEVDVEVD